MQELDGSQLRPQPQSQPFETVRALELTQPLDGSSSPPPPSEAQTLNRVERSRKQSKPQHRAKRDFWKSSALPSPSRPPSNTAEREVIDLTLCSDRDSDMAAESESDVRIVSTPLDLEHGDSSPAPPSRNGGQPHGDAAPALSSPQAPPRELAVAPAAPSAADPQHEASADEKQALHLSLPLSVAPTLLAMQSALPAPPAAVPDVADDDDDPLTMADGGMADRWRPGTARQAQVQALPASPKVAGGNAALRRTPARGARGQGLPTSFPPIVTAELRRVFKECPLPSRETKNALVQSTGLSQQQVANWFSKQRHQQQLKEDRAARRTAISPQLLQAKPVASLAAPTAAVASLSPAEREHASAVLSTLRDARSADGQTPIAQPFVHVPPRGEEAAYLRTIRYPIDLDSIQKHLNTRKSYRSPWDFAYAVELCLTNAQIYYPEGSRVHADAERMRELLHRAQRAHFGAGVQLPAAHALLLGETGANPPDLGGGAAEQGSAGVTPGESAKPVKRSHIHTPHLPRETLQEPPGRPCAVWREVPGVPPALLSAAQSPRKRVRDADALAAERVKSARRTTSGEPARSASAPREALPPPAVDVPPPASAPLRPAPPPPRVRPLGVRYHYRNPMDVRLVEGPWKLKAFKSWAAVGAITQWEVECLMMWARGAEEASACTLKELLEAAAEERLTRCR